MERPTSLASRETLTRFTPPHRRPAVLPSPGRIKRAFDVAVALLLIACALPIGLLAAWVILADSPGPVLFRQKRIGYRGRTFRVLKFRTMLDGADKRLRQNATLHDLHRANGFKLSPDVDSRVTGVGRFLRASSIDELPQLWNVLKGEMSIIGPRPMVPKEVQDIDPDTRAIILSVKPGLTGLWQVSGRSRIVGEERVRLDAEYALTRSFWVDLRILIRTIPAVLSRNGAH